MTFEKNKSYRVHLPFLGRVQRIHIVELIENDMIVYKYFGKHKQWWHYKINSSLELNEYYERMLNLRKKVEQ